MSRCNTPADCGIRLILAVNHCDIPVTAVCRYIKREHWSYVLDIAVWSPAVSLGLANQSDRRHKQRTPFTNSRRIFLSQLLENGVPIPREAPLLLLLLFFNEPQSLQKRMANVNRLRVVAVSYGTVSTVRQASGPTAPIRVRSLCVPTTRPNPIRCNPLPVEPCRRTISTENNPPAPDTPRPAARAPASVLRPLPNRYDCVVRQKLTTAGDGLEGDGSAVSDLRPHPQGRGGAAVAEREGGGGERTRQQQL